MGTDLSSLIGCSLKVPAVISVSIVIRNVSIGRTITSEIQEAYSVLDTTDWVD
jgi:hypothetical protein